MQPTTHGLTSLLTSWEDQEQSTIFILHSHNNSHKSAVCQQSAKRGVPFLPMHGAANLISLMQKSFKFKCIAPSVVSAHNSMRKWESFYHRLASEKRPRLSRLSIKQSTRLSRSTTPDSLYTHARCAARLFTFYRREIHWWLVCWEPGKLYQQIEWRGEEQSGEKSSQHSAMQKVNRENSPSKDASLYIFAYIWFVFYGCCMANKFLYANILSTNFKRKRCLSIY